MFLATEALIPATWLNREKEAVLRSNSYRIDAVFHYAVQGLIQPGTRHIMPVLPDANGLGVDFDQFSQRSAPPGE